MSRIVYIIVAMTFTGPGANQRVYLSIDISNKKRRLFIYNSPNLS